LPPACLPGLTIAIAKLAIAYALKAHIFSLIGAWLIVSRLLIIALQSRTCRIVGVSGFYQVILFGKDKKKLFPSPKKRTFGKTTRAKEETSLLKRYRHKRCPCSFVNITWAFCKKRNEPVTVTKTRVIMNKNIAEAMITSIKVNALFFNLLLLSSI
jgi:hypothetical protein